MSDPAQVFTALSIGTPLVSAASAGAMTNMADKAGNARWESAAIILAVGVVLSGMFFGVSRVIRELRENKLAVVAEVQEESAETRLHTTKKIEESQAFSHQWLENLRFPAWYKNTMGVMVYINPAYQVTFGVTASQYVGKRDDEVWSVEIAREFQKHDSEVMSRMVEVQFTELVPERVNDPQSRMHLWFVVKFPVIDRVTGSVKGVGGYCIPREMAERASNGENKLWTLTRGEMITGDVGPNPHQLPIEAPRRDA